MSHPKNFCVLPWVHLATTSSGNLRVCCNSTPGPNIIRKENGAPYKLHNSDIKEAWNGTYYKNLRTQFLDNERPQICQRCFREEDAGLKSARQSYNERYLKENYEYKVEAEYDIKYVDLRLGNLCNLKCRMCNPYSSNIWVKEWHQVVNALTPEEYDQLKNMNWPENPKTWENLFDIAHTVEMLYLTGGEPTIIKEQHKILDYLIEKDYAKNITLKYNTNLTNIPKHLLDKWKKFKNIILNCSIDAYGNLDRYIRHPSNWNTIENNFKKIRLLSNVYIEIHCTVQMYNILKLNELIDWITPHNHRIYFNILNHPEQLNIRVLPKHLKDLAAERLQPYLHLEKVQGIIDYMYAEDWTHYIDHFKDYTSKLDKSRGENLLAVVPELDI